MKALANYKEMLKYAHENKFTIGGFNTFNLETARAMVDAAEKMETPIIVQSYHNDLDLPTTWGIAAVVNAFAEKSSQPVALGLDHGENYEQAKLCIESGFSGVMIDLSTNDYDTNVREVRRVVELARKYDVSVEAELGTICTGDVRPEDMVDGFTDPQMARQFVLDTGVDCLAVSIGTAHGAYFHECRIDFDRLGELLEVVPCPIVVHGGSGTPDEDILKMVKMGISKLNVGTDFMNAYNKALLGTMLEKNAGTIEGWGKTFVHPLVGATAAYKAVYETALEKLSLLTRYRTDK